LTIIKIIIIIIINDIKTTPEVKKARDMIIAKNQNGYKFILKKLLISNK